MIRKLHSQLPLYHFNKLEQQKGIRHFVSSRAGGLSKGEFSSLNISYSTKDNPENVRENRGRIAKAIGLSPNQLVFARQTHDSQILAVKQEFLLSGADRQQELLLGIDALITQQANACLCVTAADCVPLLFYDPKQKAVGAAHAGWRGTAKRIAFKTIQSMQREFGSNAADVIVCFGPSISGKAYEVGAEVLQAMETIMGSIQGLVNNINPSTGQGYLDLWETNKRQLLEAGVLEENIEISNICTFNQQELFFSARRFKGKGGRFCAGIALLP